MTRRGKPGRWVRGLERFGIRKPSKPELEMRVKVGGKQLEKLQKNMVGYASIITSLKKLDPHELTNEMREFSKITAKEREYKDIAPHERTKEMEEFLKKWSPIIALKKALGPELSPGMEAFITISQQTPIFTKEERFHLNRLPLPARLRTAIRFLEEKIEGAQEKSEHLRVELNSDRKRLGLEELPFLTVEEIGDAKRKKLAHSSERNSERLANVKVRIVEARHLSAGKILKIKEQFLASSKVDEKRKKFIRPLNADKFRRYYIAYLKHHTGILERTIFDQENSLHKNESK